MVRVLLPFPTPAPASLDVDGERFHYLAHVLRLSVGDELEVFDGQGHRCRAKVEARHEGSLRLSLGPSQAEARGAHLTLVQGLPKGDKLEWVLQKATELGADAFRPADGERSVQKLPKERAPERVKRWARICEEAARQSGRADVPGVHAPAPLLDAVRAALGEAPHTPPGLCLVLDEEERALPLRQALLSRTPPPERIVLVIGPEGGLSRAEVEALRAEGALAVSLGARVLRTETAAIVSVALVRHLLGELG